jgi:hypothetical protein
MNYLTVERFGYSGALISWRHVDAVHLEVQVPARPQITGAYGAALLARSQPGGPRPGRFRGLRR